MESVKISKTNKNKIEQEQPIARILSHRNENRN